MVNRGHRHARGLRCGDQAGFGFEAHRHLGTPAPALWRTAQHERHTARGTTDVEGPRLLARAAGEPVHALDVASTWLDHPGKPLQARGHVRVVGLHQLFTSSGTG